MINYLVVEPTDLKYMRSRQIGSFPPESRGKNKKSLKPPAHIFSCPPFRLIVTTQDFYHSFMVGFSIVIPTFPWFLGKVNINPPPIFGFSLGQCNQTPPRAPNSGATMQLHDSSEATRTSRPGPLVRWEVEGENPRFLPTELGFPDWRGGNQKSGIY